MNWWQMTDEEIEGNPEKGIPLDPQAYTERQKAYKSTFLLTAHGQQVLADMRRRAFTSGVVEASASEHALMHLALNNLMNKIRELCGVEDELAVIQAEVQASQFYEDLEEPKPEPDPLEP